MTTKTVIMRVTLNMHCTNGLYLTPNPSPWLRIRERISFKLCLMVCKALSGSAPSYITELCVPVASVRHRSALRSAALAFCSSRGPVWSSASVRSPSQALPLGTTCLTLFGAHQHVTSLNSVWRLISSDNHIGLACSFSWAVANHVPTCFCKAPL